MQNLIVGEEYVATLCNEHYWRQSVRLKYLGLYRDDDEWTKKFLVMENKCWEGEGVYDGSGVWEEGVETCIVVYGYSFIPYNVILENE